MAIKINCEPRSFTPPNGDQNKNLQMQPPATPFDRRTQLIDGHQTGKRVTALAATAVFTLASLAACGEGKRTRHAPTDIETCQDSNALIGGTPGSVRDAILNASEKAGYPYKSGNPGNDKKLNTGIKDIVDNGNYAGTRGEVCTFTNINQGPVVSVVTVYDP